jgi:hypothetical protein
MSADQSQPDPRPDPSGLQLASSAERGLSGLLAEAVDGHIATFAEHVAEGLLAASTAVGLEVMAEMMEAEVTDLAGPKGRHDADRAATRHGSEAGSVTLGGASPAGAPPAGAQRRRGRRRAAGGVLQLVR